MGQQESNSIDPGPSHCQSYNTHISNAETLSAAENNSVGELVINEIHAGIEYNIASKHADHTPESCTSAERPDAHNDSGNNSQDLR